MDVVMIAAYSGEGRVIGRNNGLPWHIPEDLRRFKELTMGHPVIMGRATYDSIGMPLPGRTNIVLTRNPGVHGFPADVRAYSSLEDALDFAGSIDDVAYVIGGQSVYKQALPLSSGMEITEVYGNYEGDAFFPEFSPDDWEIIYTGDRKASRNGMDSYRFVTYRRKAL